MEQLNMMVSEKELYTLSVWVRGFVYYLASWSNWRVPGDVRLHSAPEYCKRFNSLEDLEPYYSLVAEEAFNRFAGEPTQVHIETWVGRGTANATLLAKTIKTQ
jgi:hypothetical protein